MTQTNGISIDLSTYRKFCRIIMMIKLTGVVNLQYLSGDRERERKLGEIRPTKTLAAQVLLNEGTF